MMSQTPIMKHLTHLYRSTSSIDVKKSAIEPLINLLADSTYLTMYYALNTETFCGVADEGF